MKKILIPLFLALLLCGCYDSTEVDDLAYVVAIGIDAGENEHVKLSLQYVVPLNISGGINGAGGDGSPLQTITFEASSLQLAQDIANNSIAKITDLSHVKLILFSSEVAKSGLARYRNDLQSVFSIRPDASVAICEGTAADCLEKASTPLELNPSRYYEDFFSPSSSAYTIRQEIGTLLNGKPAFAVPYLSYTENEIKITGMAVLKQDTFIALYSPAEAVIYNLLRKEIRDLRIETDCAVYKIDTLLPPRPHIETNPALRIQYRLSLSAELIACKSDLPPTPDEAKQDICRHLEKSVLHFLYKTQKQNCDILDLQANTKLHFLTEKAFESYKFNEKYENASMDICLALQYKTP